VDGDDDGALDCVQPVLDDGRLAVAGDNAQA